MKKILIVGIFVFAFALTMNVAFAGTCYNSQHQVCPCPDQSNTAIGVTNGISSQAISGGNTISGAFAGGSIYTGASISGAAGINAINSNLKTGMSMGTSSQTNTAMFSENGITSGSQSGVNGISGTLVGGGTVVSGASISGAKGINLVNTNIKIGCSCFGRPTCGCN